MASVSIPKPVVSGLKKLASLTEEQFQELYAAFQSIPVRIKQGRIFDDSEIKLTSISASDLELIRNSVYPLVIGSSSIPVSLSEYVKDVVQAVTEDEEPLTAETATQLTQRLDQFLQISPLRLIAKAYDVLLEHGSTFSHARVMTDLRPIFDEDVEEKPKAAVIVHMLNIDHGERKNFAVALDTRDVQQLIDALERAKKKAESIKSLLVASGMTYVEIS